MSGQALGALVTQTRCGWTSGRRGTNVIARPTAVLAEINRNLVAAGVIGADEVFVLITEIGANVSFGKGLAQRGCDVAVRLSPSRFHVLGQLMARPPGG